MNTKELLKALQEGIFQVDDEGINVFLSPATYDALMTLLSSANDTEKESV